MKKQNKKLITFLLAGAVCCTAAIGVANLQAVKGYADGESSSEELVVTPTQYLLSDLFSSNGSDAVGSADFNDKKVTAFTLSNDEYAYYRNSIALKWYDGDKDASTQKYLAEYYTLKFAFADANFTSISVKMDSVSSIASETGKAVNEVKFTKTAASDTGVTVKVSVIADGDEEKVVCSAFTAAFGDQITLALTQSDLCKYSDQFEVLLTDKDKNAINTERALFKNVGENYAAYSTESGKERYPLQFVAFTEEKAADGESEVTEYKETQIYLYELNNQSFVDVQDNKITDNAPPVLVVNEDVNGFMLGSKFSLNYQVIDVAKKSLASTDKALTYYQYNPTDTEISYSALSTSTPFTETYYTDPQSGENKSVYEVNNSEEFVTIRFTLGDSTFKVDPAQDHDYNKAVFDLVWYAEEDALRVMDGNEYVVINRSDVGALYAKGSGEFDAYVKADATEKVNKYLTVDNSGNASYVSEKEVGAYENSELKKFVDSYNAALVKAAEDVYAGSNVNIVFPTFEHFFYDDNGYRNLKFVICYKSESGTSSNTSPLSYSSLKLSATTAGKYEFKIYAVDEAGNHMKYVDSNGELVDVDDSNIWDIEAIPTFEYTIKSQGLKIKNETSTKTTEKTTTKAVGEKYTLSGITVVGGAKNQKSDFSLYKVNLKACEKYNLNLSSLAKVTYQEIRIAAQDKLAGVQADETYKGDYLAMYFDVYLSLLKEKSGVDVDKLKECFVRIEEYNSKITKDDPEWDAYNKYEFKNGSASSFKVLDEGGTYVLFANYWDEDLSNYARVAAYKVIKAEEKADVITGETEWLKNNLVSIVLFSIAGVMLILIIVLLLIKPSDETLEDVDEKAKAKKNAKVEKEQK